MVNEKKEAYSVYSTARHTWKRQQCAKADTHLHTKSQPACEQQCQASSVLPSPSRLLHHMASDKQCEGTRDWHVEACATGDATGYCQSHTAPRMRALTVTWQHYRLPLCRQEMALFGSYEVEVPNVIAGSRAKARHTTSGEKWSSSVSGYSYYIINKRTNWMYNFTRQGVWK